MQAAACLSAQVADMYLVHSSVVPVDALLYPPLAQFLLSPFSFTAAPCVGQSMYEYMEQNVQDSSKVEENDPSGSGQILEQSGDITGDNMAVCAEKVCVCVCVCLC